MASRTRRQTAIDDDEELDTEPEKKSTKSKLVSLEEGEHHGLDLRPDVYQKRQNVVIEQQGSLETKSNSKIQQEIDSQRRTNNQKIIDHVMNSMVSEKRRPKTISKIDPNWSEPVIIKLFETIHAKYTVRDPSQSITDWVYEMYNLPPNPSLQDIELSWRALLVEISLFKQEFITKQIGNKFDANFKACYDSIWNTFCFLNFELALDPMRKCAGTSTYIEFLKFKGVDPETMKGSAKLVFFAQQQASVFRLRKRGDYVYREIRTPDGKHGTHAWERWKTILEFLHYICPKNQQFDNWQLLCDRGVKKSAVEFLTECDDVEWPYLNEDRTISSWLDGLYFAKIGTFIEYGTANIPDSFVACKFFNMKFRNFEGKHNESRANRQAEIEAQLAEIKSGANIPEDKLLKPIEEWTIDHINAIPTPLDKILADQKYDPEEASFIFAMLGRMIMPPREFDMWEKFLFFWGQARAGKGCMLEAIQCFFNPIDSKPFADRMEETFGLMSLYEMKTVLGMDVKKSFNLSPGTLQSMVSHEEICISIKNKPAVTTRWKPTIAFAGNEWPTIWRDQLGALMDRVVFVSFLKKVDPSQKDTNLKRRIPLEIDAIMEKCILSYHWWLKRAGTKDIGACMPEKFVKARYIVREQGNPFEQFLSSSRVEILDPKDPDYNNAVTSETDIFEAYTQYCTDWKKPAKANAVDPSDVRGSLEGRLCRYEDVKMEYQPKYWISTGKREPKQRVQQDFYFGIRIRDKHSRTETSDQKEKKEKPKASKKDKDKPKKKKVPDGSLIITDSGDVGLASSKKVKPDQDV